MKVLNSLYGSALFPQSAIALGFFDGVHLGHRAVLERALQSGAALPLVVATFQLPPGEARKGNLLIYDYAIRTSLLESAGAAAVLEPPFSELVHLPAEVFFEKLCQRLCPRVIAVGEDYRFGAGATGDVLLLAALCKERDIALCVLGDVMVEGARVSSSRIRALLEQGDIPGATALLGERYRIDSRVVYGRRIGTTLGFPTVNQLFPPGVLVPRFGVYLSVATLGDRQYRALTNIGVRPTVEDGALPRAETHIFDYQGDLYEKAVLVELCHFLRPEVKFSHLDALKEQLRQDKQAALQFPMEIQLLSTPSENSG